MLDDRQLLERYISSACEEAFAELVRRHMGLVYSAALRQVRDPQRAQDVTQIVFANLARKAASIPPSTILAGWLHRDTRYTALDLLRAEARRARREQQAVVMNDLDRSPPESWEHIRPLLDQALDELPPSDRDALLLRFFEQRDFAAVGAGLSATAEAARKRVERALDKLRERLVKRGITTTAAALCAALSAHALEPLPAGLALSLVTHSVAAAAAAPAGTGWLTHLVLMTKSKLALSSILLAGALATPLLVQQQALALARAEHAVLEARVQELPPSSAPATRNDSPDDSVQRQRDELQRLRTEAALLKTRVADLRARLPREASVASTPKLPGTPIGQTLRLQDARDVGQATPEALVQTFLASMLHGDTNRLAQLMESDPATDPAVLQKSWEEMVSSAAQAQTNGLSFDSSHPGPPEVRLLEEQPAGDNDRWLVSADVRSDGSVGTPSRVKLRLTDAGWKLLLGTNGVPINEKVQDAP